MASRKNYEFNIREPGIIRRCLIIPLRGTNMVIRLENPHVHLKPHHIEAWCGASGVQVVFTNNQIRSMDAWLSSEENKDVIYNWKVLGFRGTEFAILYILIKRDALP